MRHSYSKTSSSCSTSRSHSSTKFGRLTGTCRFASGFSGGREVRVVRQRRVAAHAEVVLHPALGRQAVVVPAHRVEHLLAAHPLVARDQVGVRVGEHVPDVQRARDGRRGSVDRVDLLARLGAVEGVGVVGLPALGPGGLQTLERRLVRYDARSARPVGCVVSDRSGVNGSVVIARNPTVRPPGTANQFGARRRGGRRFGACGPRRAANRRLAARCQTRPRPPPSRRTPMPNAPCSRAGRRPGSSRRWTGSRRSPSCSASHSAPIR